MLTSPDSFWATSSNICKNWTKSDIATAVTVVSSAVATLHAAHYVTNKIRDIQKSGRLKKIIDERRKLRDENLEKLRRTYKFGLQDKSIVDLPVEDLILKLQKRELTAVQVYQAYMGKAIAVTIKFNCITEFVPYAAEIAEELDKLSEPKGPLHGVPICIKDDHDVQGMDSTLGLGKNLNKAAQKNAALVQVLIVLGAIPFCKTNVPQSLFSMGSDNPIFGQTLNPLNTKLSPGGSSSGTGSLISAGGAPFGTGSDFGGSLRIPAHFNGICSIRPTLNRLSSRGIVQLLPKCVGVKGVPGIMAKDAKIVASIFRAITLEGKQNEHDPQALPIPWNDKIFQSTKPLRIGFFTSVSFFPALGDTSETVLKAKEALENLGHTLVPYSIKDNWKIMKLCNDIICLDFGENSYLKDHVFANEPAAKGLEGVVHMSALRAWRRRLLSYISKILSNSKRIPLLAAGGLDQSTSKDVWEMMHHRNEIMSSILNDMEVYNLDLLLSPAFPFAACPLNNCGNLLGAIIYTMIWNLVDFPAGIVTYGKESGKNLDSYNDEGDTLLKYAKEGAKESVGAPIAVQLIGRPYKEEVVLRAMMELGQTYEK